MYSYRSEKVHIFYRMKDDLTTIEEEIIEENKDHIPKTKRPIWCFFQTSEELQKVNATLHTARFWHTVMLMKMNKT